MKRARRAGVLLALGVFASITASPAGAQTDQDEPAVPHSKFIPGNVESPMTGGPVLQFEAPPAPKGLSPATATIGTRFAGFNTIQPARILDTRTGTGAPAAQVTAGGSVNVQVAGRAGVPVDAGAVILNVTVAEPTSAGYVTVWPAGAPRPNASSLNFVQDQTIPNSVIAKLGTGGQVSFYNDTGSSHLIADVVGWARDDQHYNALNPARILDTRSNVGLSGRAGAGQTVTLPATGVGGVPASGVGAVVLNVTVTEPTDTSYVTVWPADAPRPTASSLNMIAGQTVPNLVIAKVSGDGRVAFFNERGSTHLIADVVGWIPAGAAYLPVNPTRVLDTRLGEGNYGVPSGTSFVKPAGPLPERGQIDLDLSSLYPAYGAVAGYVFNVTATNPTAVSYLTMWPAGAPRPNASNLNMTPGRTAPNLVVAKPGAAGRVSIYNDSGSTDVIVDLVGVVPLQNALDTPDDNAGSKFHVLYVQAADSADDPAMPAKIGDDIAAMDGWFASQTGRHIDIDRRNGGIEVTTWRLAGYTRADFAQVGYSLPTTLNVLVQLGQDGFGSPYGRRWLVYLDAQGLGGLCGVTLGQWTSLFTASACTTTAPIGTTVAANVGNGPNAVQVALHEMLHGMGAVPSCAPHLDRNVDTDGDGLGDGDPNYNPSSPQGHTSDPNDLMYWNAANQPKYIDPARHDYFGHGRPDCPDLARSAYLLPAG